MTHHHTHEDPGATHARLTAAALAELANACAAADAFLVDGTILDPENPPATIVLADTENGRRATIDAGAPDEWQFTDIAALRVYVRTCLVASMSVRREGWTAPNPADSRIRPDTARLLLRTSNPLVDIVAGIGRDGSLDAPSLRYGNDDSGMRRFDHNAHELDERGIRYLASLFRT
ncbi:MAG: hypothetical protein F4018_03420 [Acidobacteria bacterium]|nr:hypothetical protein [Acidobacteriota bacterium]